MRPDLSALDAQLDALSPAPAFDVVALARAYAGSLELKSVDDALAALESNVVSAPVAQAVSEAIELPEPMRDALLVEEETGQHTLDEASSRALHFMSDSDTPITAQHDIEPLVGKSDFAMRESGAFSVPSTPASREERDITIEPIDEELIDSEIAEMRPEAAPLGNVASSLFDLNTPANAEAEIEADAAFAALFAEATRQSSMPNVSEQEPADDTEVFHTSELAIDPNSISVDPNSFSLKPSIPYELALTQPAAKGNDNEVELEPGFHDETLDSAEFEIVNDVVTDARPANSPSARPHARPRSARASSADCSAVRKTD